MVKQTNSKKAKKVNELDKLLEQHKHQFTTLENGKIKCILTGHEFLPSESNLLAHLNSKSYKKAAEAQFDITQYEQVLSTHKDNENFLFCRLTGAKVPKKKTAIQKHVNGKKFKARFQQYKAQLEEEEEDEQLIDDQAEEEEGEQEEVDEEEQEQVEQEEEEEEEEQSQQSEEEQPSKKGKNKKNNKNHKQKHIKKPQSTNNNNKSQAQSNNSNKRNGHSNKQRK